MITDEKIRKDIIRNKANYRPLKSALRQILQSYLDPASLLEGVHLLLDAGAKLEEPLQLLEGYLRTRSNPAPEIMDMLLAAVTRKDLADHVVVRDCFISRAIRKGDDPIATAKKLIAAGLDIEVMANFPRLYTSASALLYAVHKRKVHLASTLLQVGAKPTHSIRSVPLPPPLRSFSYPLLLPPIRDNLSYSRNRLEMRRWWPCWNHI